MTLPRYTATRYAVPLKEGGSLPAVVETDEDGLYVVKFVGAGQGARALIAEIIVGELARHLGLPMPDLALVDVPPSFGRSEADPEIQDLLRASHGINLGMRYLEGAFNYDAVAAADLATPNIAASIVWLDAFTMNIDRTVRNPNMMVWKDGLWLIDHGAALYFHHSWSDVTAASMVRPFAQIENHVLLSAASDVLEADEQFRTVLSRDVFEEIVEQVPEELLMHSPVGTTPSFGSAALNRVAYVDALSHRLASDEFARVAELARRGAT